MGPEPFPSTDSRDEVERPSRPLVARPRARPAGKDFACAALRLAEPVQSDCSLLGVGISTPSSALTLQKPWSYVNSMAMASCLLTKLSNYLNAVERNQSFKKKADNVQS